jgi:hypothetical protein
MYKPKDFLPAKYRSQNPTAGFTAGTSDDPAANSSAVNKMPSDSPWSDLAKTPKVPEYRSQSQRDTEQKLAALKTTELQAQHEQNQKDQRPVNANQARTLNNKKPGLINQKLAGLLMVFFLVIGVFASYLLSRQNQDLRQKAYIPDEPTDPYPEGEICTNPNGCVIGWEIVEK